MAPAGTSISPSPAQAALALAILNAKPPAISARGQCHVPGREVVAYGADYVLRLRSHLQLGDNPGGGPKASHYIDLVSYWKTQCQNVTEECDRLRSVNIKLERSSHQLANLMSPDIGAESVPKSPKRRERTSSPARTAKRPRFLQTNGTKDIPATAPETVEMDSNFLDTLGHDGMQLMEALFVTHGLCRASTTEAEKLCSSLVKTSSALGKVILTVVRHSNELSGRGSRLSVAQSLDQDKSDLGAALSVCARTFMSLLIGLSKLHHTGSADNFKSLVIYELVNMFEIALQSIQNATLHTAQAFRRKCAVSNKVASPREHYGVMECTTARSIAHLLIGFLGQLDENDQDHQRMFDGFTFTLLQRAAKWLYYHTFGEQRSVVIEKNIMRPNGAESQHDSPQEDLDVLAGQMEVKALVLILERAIALAPNHLETHSDRLERRATQAGGAIDTTTLPQISQAALSVLAKERLQRTLISCMYDRRCEDEFLDVLTKPIPAISMNSLPQITILNNNNVSEWFKQEVWRLVGWDLLIKEHEW